ncbi:MAG: hypothetical protein ACKO6G_06880 [Vulcanococcus sp.]
MAQAGTSATAAAPRRPLWAGPLVAGFCFALTYGVSQRLIGLNVGELIRFGNGFDVQVFPGTSLESLRLRFGEAEAEIRADLELQELQRQQQEQAKRQAEEARRLEAELRQADQLQPLPDEPLEDPPAPALPAAAPPAPPALPR